MATLAEMAPDLGALDSFRGAISRARETGRAVLVSRTREVAALPDLIELFGAAEARGERRFFAASSTRRLRRLGLGAALTVDAKDAADAARLARAAFVDAETVAGPLGGPTLVGGGAFVSRSRRPDPVWRDFGAARFCVPELELVQVAETCQVTWSCRITPEHTLESAAEAFCSRWNEWTEKSEVPARAPVVLDAPPPEELALRYQHAAAAALEQIREGRVDKVVLADVEPLRIHGHLRAADVIAELEDKQAAALTYAQGFGPHTFVGATPERLVRVVGRSVETGAVAGTAPVGEADVEAVMHADVLLHSEKDLREHEFVVGAIEDAIGPLCVRLERAPAPTLLGAGRAQHLYTPITGELRDSSHVLELVARLHPTPAVGGVPRAAALEVIAELEHFDRGWYAGPIGWCDADGGGEFFVALRCALVTPDEVRLFAGAGLVAGSDPAAEAAETALKLRAVRDALEAACA